MSTDTRTIQIANTSTGDYDVQQSLPYPFHVASDGSVLRQDFWQGSPAALAGFQKDRDVQHVDLHAHDWLATDDLAPAGWYAVFIDSNGRMWSTSNPVAK